MGCCTASNSKRKDVVIDPKKVMEVKSRLKASKMQSSVAMSEETTLMISKAKAQSFNCRFVGLVHIHNYLMLLRDKSSQVIRDASQLVLLDIRSQADYEIAKVFKS